IAAGSSDACGIATKSVTPDTFACANVGSNPVALTVTDVNGNANTCNTTVTVVDNTPPSVSCTAITVHLNASGSYTLTAADVSAIAAGSSDACGIATKSVTPDTFACANVGSNPVALTVTDVNGNANTCNTTVTVVDNTPPSVSCTAITVHLNASGSYTLTAADVS